MSNETDSQPASNHQSSLHITSSTTITFNHSINSTWNIVGSLDSSETLIINNMDYDMKQISVDSSFRVILEGLGTVILNNCTIHNMKVSYYPVIRAWNIKIYNSTFINVTAETPISDETNGFFVNGWGGYVILENNKFVNLELKNMHFLYGNMYSGGMMIDKCIFDHIELNETFALFSIASIESEIIGEIVSMSRMDIRHSSFHHLYGGSLMSIDDGLVIMENIDIISDFLGNHDAALLQVHSTAETIIDNLRLTYEWSDKWRYICDTSIGDTSVVNTCEYGIPLLDNDGSVLMENIYISDDITEIALNQYRDYLIDDLLLNNDTLFTFYFNIKDVAKHDRYHLIKNTAYIKMSNFTFHGVAVYPALLKNTGTAIMTNINISRPSFVLNNYNPINIKTFFSGYMIWNERTRNERNIVIVQNPNSCYTSGILSISDSFIEGCHYAVFDLYGSVQIYNTSIKDTMIIRAAFYSTTFHLIGCDIYNCPDDKQYPLQLVNVGNVIIKKNIFDFYPVNGI